MNIHQEVTIAASPSSVFRALVDAEEFGKATGAPASGEPVVGGAFSAFGGHVTGRHVELAEGERVVQAWRAKTWPAGVYSIARFELKNENGTTRLVFDHDGFPEDMKDHLAAGWQSDYWEKLKAHLEKK